MSQKTHIQWKNEYRLGNAQIDKEHEEFFSIAQKAHNLHSIEDDVDKKSELRSIMTELFAYINYHFDSEEAFMKKINYPQLNEHLQLHKEMKDQLNFINFNLLNMEISQAEEKLYHFVQKIFLDHILHEDLKVVNFNN